VYIDGSYRKIKTGVVLCGPLCRFILIVLSCLCPYRSTVNTGGYDDVHASWFRRSWSTLVTGSHPDDVRSVGQRAGVREDRWTLGSSAAQSADAVRRGGTVPESRSTWRRSWVVESPQHDVVQRLCHPTVLALPGICSSLRPGNNFYTRDAMIRHTWTSLQYIS